MPKSGITRLEPEEIAARRSNRAINRATVRDENAVLRGAAPQFKRPHLGRVNEGPESRRRLLLNYRPRRDPVFVASVRNTVVDLVCAVNLSPTEANRAVAASVEADQNMARALYRLAEWCVLRKGSFDGMADLDEAVLLEFEKTGLDDLTHGSVLTYKAQLRRVRRRGDAIEGVERPRAHPPYEGREVERFWTVLDLAGGWREDIEMLLTLTFRCGLAPSEVHRATGDWIRIRSPRRADLTVPGADGTFRVVPLRDALAIFFIRWKQEHDESDWLFRGSYATRRNAISDLKCRLVRTVPTWRTFLPWRARNTWLCELLTMPVPFNVVCEVAGIGGDSHLLADLVPYLPGPTEDQVHRALRAASGRAIPRKRGSTRGA